MIGQKSSRWHDSTRIPPIVSICIHSWMLSNPDYKINILNNDNMHELIDVPSSDFWKDSFYTNIRHVTFTSLRKHGGIWIDSSILIRTPFSQWLFNHCDINQKQMYGFYLDSWSVNGKPPVIESWFIASKRNSYFMREWRKEFMSIGTFSSIREYVDTRRRHVFIDNINDPHYLAIHVSAQTVVQTNDVLSSLCLLKAEDSAYYYLSMNDWDSTEAVKYACDHVCEFDIIKFRGYERRVFEENPHLFSQIRQTFSCK